MTSERVGFNSFLKIVRILKELSLTDDPSLARRKYLTFPTLAEHITRLFYEDRLFDILPRLEVELEIVRRYDPPVRPALDPYVSTQIGIFSKNFSDCEVGCFFDYPECCVHSFVKELRYGLDDKHYDELKKVKGKIFVVTAGFVPCSVFCKESHNRGLISFIDRRIVDKLRLIEKDLANRLPHFHSEYQGHYYEIKYA